MRGGITDSDVRAVPPGVQHEKRSVAVPEVIVVLTKVWRVEVSLGVIKLERIRGALEGYLRIIPLTDVVVNDLGKTSATERQVEDQDIDLMIVVGMEDGYESFMSCIQDYASKRNVRKRS